jgi:hypothetical protein
MNMKAPVVAIIAFLTIIYLSALLAVAKRAQVQGCGAAAQESERTHTAPSSKVVAAKGGPQTPGELLTQNKRLSDKLSALLRQQDPPLTDLLAASQGFTNLGQVFAAVHISQNLDIPLDQLKAQEQTSGSLADAIHTLKPNADTKAELWKAAEQAVDDLEDSYWATARSFSPSM